MHIHVRIHIYIYANIIYTYTYVCTACMHACTVTLTQNAHKLAIAGVSLG